MRLFTHVQTEGGLLPSSLLPRLADDRSGVDGLSPASYGLSGERVAEATARSWGRLTAAWEAFRAAREKLPEDDAATGVTRDRWLMPLLQELGFGRLPAARATTIDEKDYPISHFYGESVPVHLVGAGVSLDRRTPGVRGAAQASPHSLVQEFLNRSDDHLWGIVTNGLRFRILRDNIRLTRPAFVEFDLEGMFEGEAYADFALLWRVAHVSRFDGESPEQCWLERWTELAQAEGTRVLGGLRVGVEEALTALGRGFLAHRKNTALRLRLEDGSLSRDDYYRQLLRLVYRLLFLFVAEDRGLLHPPHDTADRAAERARERYRRYASTTRLRELSRKMRGTQHTDLFAGLQAVMRALGEDGAPAWGLPALGSDLWSGESLADLDAASLSNRALLDAVRALATTQADGVRQAVDYRNLGSEELGSVYESLLELHPQIETKAGHFELQGAAGHERKTTGSYYTPRGLVDSLLDSALEPLLDRAMGEEDPEAAILRLKICDPACGSGHFLVAAARRLARRLARIRSGDEEPTPGAVQEAVREVVGRCLYGVDLNPMAVELCKVSLWLEALEPGKPLGFLDHHIRGGNSLLGTNPRRMADGVPNDAFKPIEGDEKPVAREVKKANRTERGNRDSQLALFSFSGQEILVPLGEASRAMREVDALADETIEGQREKRDRFRAHEGSRALAQARQTADTWCSAFVWPLQSGAPRPPTDELFRDVLLDASRMQEPVRERVRNLADEYQFFHYHVAFPEVFPVPTPDESPANPVTGLHGGFDLVLGNPPWEKIQLNTTEFFQARDPEIARISSNAPRVAALKRLEQENPTLYAEYQRAKRLASGSQHFLHTAGRFPRSASGQTQTAPLFLELAMELASGSGAIALVVPTAVVTDTSNQHLFREMIESGTLRSVVDFENREGLFPGVHRSFKFCLLSLDMKRADQPATFSFFLRGLRDTEDKERSFELNQETLHLFSRNTGTCPVFRTRRDAKIVEEIFARVPVLHEDARWDENAWRVEFFSSYPTSGTDDSRPLSRGELEEMGCRLEGNVFAGTAGRFLPAYEAKMAAMWDHRAADVLMSETAVVRQAQPSPLTEDEHEDPNRLPLPRFWIEESQVAAKYEQAWGRRWFLAWRDITSPTNQRTVISMILPYCAPTGTLRLAGSSTATPAQLAVLCANLNSFVLDYCARQLIGGIHVTNTLMKELPVLPPVVESSPIPLEWFVERAVELSFTSEDLRAFAEDCGHSGSPASWCEESRAQARAELDAAFFHLYGVSRGDVEYILETFPIVKRKDMKKYGAYRTKEQILEVFDRVIQRTS